MKRRFNMFKFVCKNLESGMVDELIFDTEQQAIDHLNEGDCLGVYDPSESKIFKL